VVTKGWGASKIGGEISCFPDPEGWFILEADLDTLATAVYVTVDDLLIAHPEICPPRPTIGLAPITTDAEIVTLAVLAQLLGFTNESRWVRWAKTHMTSYFPIIPYQCGYNKRIRKLVTVIA
jgi:hypothetical protein